MDIRFRYAGARSLLSFFDPGFHVCQVPYDAAWRQVEATWELTATLHFVDRRFGEGNDLPQFLPANGATKGKDTALWKLRQSLVGIRAWQGEADIGAGGIGGLR